MSILAESKKYIIFNDYETVILKIKELNKEILIGDFYGDPQMAIISRNETICVMCGCGIIIYYLQEPFEKYEYNKQASQWREWGRTPGEEIWVENIKFIDDKTLEIETENNELHKINIM